MKQKSAPISGRGEQATTWMKTVVYIIATYGNRGVDEFISAFSISQQAINSAFSDEVMYKEARRAYDVLNQGLLKFNIQHPHYDLNVAHKYTHMAAAFDAI